MKTKNTGVAIIVAQKNATTEQLELCARALKQKYSKIAKDAEIHIGIPNAELIEGKLVIGNFVPSNIASSAERVIEVNTYGFWSIPARVREMLEVEEVQELFKYAESYRLKEAYMDADGNEVEL